MRLLLFCLLGFALSDNGLKMNGPLIENIKDNTKPQHQTYTGLIPPITDEDTRVFLDSEYMKHGEISLIKQTQKVTSTTEITNQTKKVTGENTQILNKGPTYVRQRKKSKSGFLYKNGNISRRAFDPDFRKTPLLWIHCAELITPFLTGHKKVTENPINVNSTDHLLHRLQTLIKMPTTGYEREDYISLLYQVSSINIRLFQWRTNTIYALMKVLMGPERNHNFRNLKSALLALIKKWHLDTRNTTILMTQTRIFRPPCYLPFDIVSTMYTGGVRYSTPKTTPYTCYEYVEDGQKKKKCGDMSTLS